MEERQRILEMLEAGRISAKQAAQLLEALGGGGPEPPRPPDPPEPPHGAGAGGPRPQPPARLVRIQVHAEEPNKKPVVVNVAVPLALARFASRFMPAEARQELDRQGIDLQELFEGLEEVRSDGPLLEIDASDDGDASGKTVHVRIDVV